MKTLNQEIKEALIDARLIGRYIWHLHKKGFRGEQLKKELLSWGPIDNLGLQANANEELGKYFDYINKQKRA